MRIRQRDQHSADATAPWPLSDGATVQRYAPDLYRAHGGIEPSTTDPEWMTALMTARKTYNDYLERWMADEGMTWDEAKPVLTQRRPRWS